MPIAVADRPTTFWLRLLKQRRAQMSDEDAALSEPVTWDSLEEQRAAARPREVRRVFSEIVQLACDPGMLGSPPRRRKVAGELAHPAEVLLEGVLAPVFCEMGDRGRAVHASQRYGGSPAARQRIRCAVAGQREAVPPEHGES